MLRPFAALLAVLFWPIGSFREATTLCNAADKTTQPGDLKSRAWRAALRDNVPPSEFGSYGLWRDGAPPPDSWLYMTESSLLTAHLTDRSGIDLTGDKAGFADFCREHGSLSVVPTLAIYANGTAAHPFETGHPPESDLVTKPVRGTHSKGFQAWAYADGGTPASVTRPAFRSRRIASAGTSRISPASSRGGFSSNPASHRIPIWPTFRKPVRRSRGSSRHAGATCAPRSSMRFCNAPRQVGTCWFPAVCA